MIYFPPGNTGVMHRTESLDYVICLDGEIDMDLDDETVHMVAGDFIAAPTTPGAIAAARRRAWPLSSSTGSRSESGPRAPRTEGRQAALSGQGAPMKNEEARLTPAERERERDDVEISLAEPLGSGRVDDDNASGRPAKTAPKAHIKDDDSHRMTH